MRANPLPASKPTWSHFHRLAQQNVQVIRDIIARRSPLNESSADALSLRKLKDMYRSCMDEDTLAELGTEPLLRIVKQVRGLFKGKVGARGVEGEPQGNVSGTGGYLTGGIGLTAAISFLHSQGVVSRAHAVRIMNDKCH